MTDDISEKRFLYALEKGKDQIKIMNGIGTLSEKTVHLVLKYYFEPDETKHEIPIGKKIADIYNGEDIIEIQTKQLNRLKPKLDEFLPHYHVTVVHPVVVERQTFYVHPATGEISPGRKCRMKAGKYLAFSELYKIKPYLTNPKFHLCLLLIGVEEYRVLNPNRKNPKKGAECNDRIPTRIFDEIYINEVYDYETFLPDSLETGFTSSDFAKAAGIGKSLAQMVLNVLNDVGAVKRIGKIKNSYQYDTRVKRSYVSYLHEKV